MHPFRDQTEASRSSRGKQPQRRQALQQSYINSSHQEATPTNPPQELLPHTSLFAAREIVPPLSLFNTFPVPQFQWYPYDIYNAFLPLQQSFPYHSSCQLATRGPQLLGHENMQQSATIAPESLQLTPENKKRSTPPSMTPSSSYSSSAKTASRSSPSSLTTNNQATHQNKKRKMRAVAPLASSTPLVLDLLSTPSPSSRLPLEYVASRSPTPIPSQSSARFASPVRQSSPLPYRSPSPSPSQYSFLNASSPASSDTQSASCSSVSSSTAALLDGKKYISERAQSCCEKEIIGSLQDSEYYSMKATGSINESPKQLKVALMEHQKIGLEWMKRKERSNNKGGILADGQGLGKTIQVISLIVDQPCTDTSSIIRLQAVQEAKKHNEDKNKDKNQENGNRIKTKATLIVCPDVLVAQWECELVNKTNPPLNVYVYHGSNRTMDDTLLAEFDVIITTYNLLSYDLTKKKYKRGPLGRLIFHRVILDEAHTIIKRRSIITQACNRIDAVYRWCITATPVLDGIEDLFSLISFLNLPPYCKWETFENEILKTLYNGGNKHNVFAKIQGLLQDYSIRRFKSVKSHDEVIMRRRKQKTIMTYINLTPDEQYFYDVINKKTQAQLNKHVKQGTLMDNLSFLFGLLAELRKACLHPSLVPVEREGCAHEDNDNEVALALGMNMTVLNRISLDNINFSHIKCPICMEIAKNVKVILSCGHMYCDPCLSLHIESKNDPTCPECRGELLSEKVLPLDTVLKVHTPDHYKEIVEEEEKLMDRIRSNSSSTKIRMLLEILRTRKNQEKTIIFTGFIAFLNILELSLGDEKIKFVRMDEIMDPVKYYDALKSFYNNPKYTVLLISQKSYPNFGLYFNEVDQIIFMNPWRDETFENKIISRVCNVGRSEDITIYYILANDTIEYRMSNLKKKKDHESGPLDLSDILHIFRG